MSLYSTLKGFCLGLIITLGCAGLGLAQQPGRAQQEGAPGGPQREGRRGGPMRGRDGRMMGLMHALRELNLTDAQAEQARAIFERFAENTKPQREALEKLRGQNEQGTPSEETRTQAKQLRKEMHEAMQNVHAELVALLTPEQRTKLEQVEKDMKARQEERRKSFPDQKEQ